jgi:outer membrane receptor protein involved in Fe transport
MARSAATPYSDFKGTTIHSLSVSTHGLNDSLVLRALFAQGVRAPFAVDLKAPNATSILNGLFDPVRGGVFPVTRITGGNLNLKEERADTRDYGIVYSPPALKGLTLRADYWSVDIKDRIFAPAPQDILNGIASGGSLTRDPVTGAVTIDARSVNGTERAAAGYDFGVGYNLTTANHGRFAFDLTGTYTTKLWDKSSGVTSILLDHYAGSTESLRRRRRHGAHPAAERGVHDLLVLRQLERGPDRAPSLWFARHRGRPHRPPV